jgi:hypothetical protein
MRPGTLVMSGPRWTRVVDRAGCEQERPGRLKSECRLARTARPRGEGANEWDGEQDEGDGVLRSCSRVTILLAEHRTPARRHPRPAFTLSRELHAQSRSASLWPAPRASPRARGPRPRRLRPPLGCTHPTHRTRPAHRTRTRARVTTAPRARAAGRRSRACALPPATQKRRACADAVVRRRRGQVARRALPRGVAAPRTRARRAAAR